VTGDNDEERNELTARGLPLLYSVFHSTSESDKLKKSLVQEVETRYEGMDEITTAELQYWGAEIEAHKHRYDKEQRKSRWCLVGMPRICRPGLGFTCGAVSIATFSAIMYPLCYEVGDSSCGTSVG
jgi:hypothetical protein